MNVTTPDVANPGDAGATLEDLLTSSVLVYSVLVSELHLRRGVIDADQVARQISERAGDPDLSQRVRKMLACYARAITQ